MTDDRVREARLVVGNYVEPYLGTPLSDAKAVKSVRLDGADRRGRGRCSAFRSGRYAEELAAGARGQHCAGGRARRAA